MTRKGVDVGFDYRDALRSPAGLNKLTLRAGADGQAAVSAKLGGLDLATPAPPFAGAVTVQLRNDFRCWEAGYSSPTFNQAGLYKAKSD